MVYQEQVMQIAQKMAGYSLGGADLLRRAMGKKIRAEMEAQRKIFVERREGRGIPPAKADEIFDLMAKFADYGFNKSHAAAYALVAYQTAWMKANHPVAFLAACMSLAISNTDRLAALRQDATRMGIARAAAATSTAPARISRWRRRRRQACHPLRARRGQERRHGRDAGAGGGARRHAVCRSCRFRRPRRSARSSTACRSKIWCAPALSTSWSATVPGCSRVPRRSCAARRRGPRRRPAARSACSAAPSRSRCACRTRRTGRRLDALGFEAEAVGFHLTAHPLDIYAQALRRLGVVASTTLEAQAQRGAARVKLAGTVVASKERITRTGSRMAWVRLSDAGGSYEVTVFSEVLTRAGELLTEGNAVLVTADIRLEGETLRITAQDVTPLDEAAAQAGAGLRVWLERTEAVPHIRTLLEREGRGRGRVVLIPRLDASQDVEIALPGGFNVSPRLAQAMKMLPGVERVEDL